MSKSHFAFLLGLSLFFTTAIPAHAVWVIDLSGTLVDVDPLALSDAPPTIAEISTNRDPLEMEEEGDPGRKPDRIVDDEPGNTPASAPNSLELKTKYAQQVATRKQNLATRQQTLRTQLEAKKEGLRIRQETVNQEGKVVATKDTPLPKAERLRIEQEDNSTLEVVASEEDELTIHSSKTRTRTNFPLSIGEDNTLVITSPDGTQKEVTVLPDAAVKHLENKGFAPPSETELITEEEAPVYRADVKEEKRFLGLFKLVFDKRATVNAETGEVEGELSPRASAWHRFLDRFSF